MTDELAQERISDIANEALAKIDHFSNKVSFKVEIPKRLQDPSFRFILVDKKSKKPTEAGWPMYSFDHPRLKDHLSHGGNYGVRPGEGELCILDADDPERLRELGVLASFEDDFFVSNRDNGRGHYYFLCNKSPWKKLVLQDPERTDEKGEHPHLGELYAGVGNYQVVGPGSLHPEGRVYKIGKDMPLRRFTGEELEKIFGGFVCREIPPEYARKTRAEKIGTLTERLNLRVEDFLMPDNPVRHGDEVQGAHPTHGSETGMNLRLNTRQGIWYCFRHQTGGDALLAFAVREGIIRCDEATPGALKDARRMEEVHKALVKRGLLKEDTPPPNERANSQIDIFKCTHFGNAERFLVWNESLVRYCPQFEWWYLWVDPEGRWLRDEVGMIAELGKAAVLRIYEEAAKAPTEDRRKALANWAVRCETPGSVNQMLEVAQSNPKIVVTPDAFNQENHLINLQNGYYDLVQHYLIPHDRQHFFSMMLPFKYDPAAICPQWLAFLDRIFRSNPEKEKIIGFIQRAIGYTLTGDTSERAIFLMHGLGANGKTVFIRVLEALFGDYGASVSSSCFTTAMATNVRNDLARLTGKRFVWASENSSETVLDEEMIKRASGGDTVVCRFLFKEEFSYRPNFKIWWIFNHKPKIKDATDSLWDRFHLIPCEERIPVEEQDKKITDRLISEIPGIFNWAIAGLKEYQQIGLASPAAVKEATKEYRVSEDFIADFLDEFFEVITQEEIDKSVFNEDTRLPFKTIWNLWVEYTKQNNFKKTPSKQFLGRRLEERFKKYHTAAEKGYIGLRLKRHD